MRRVISAFSLLATAFVTACGVPCGTEQIPEIAQGLPPSYAEGEQVFNARLVARFPVGTAEVALVEELKRQGFSIKDGSSGRFATFIEKNLIVSNVWNVGWKVENGTISKIWGVYGGRGP